MLYCDLNNILMRLFIFIFSKCNICWPLTKKHKCCHCLNPMSFSNAHKFLAHVCNICWVIMDVLLVFGLTFIVHSLISLVWCIVIHHKFLANLAYCDSFSYVRSVGSYSNTRQGVRLKIVWWSNTVQKTYIDDPLILDCQNQNID